MIRHLLLLGSILLTVSGVDLAKDSEKMSVVERDKQIKTSLDHIQFIEDLSGVKLEKNEDFHAWLMATGKQELPMRL